MFMSERPKIGFKFPKSSLLTKDNVSNHFALVAFLASSSCTFSIGPILCVDIRLRAQKVHEGKSGIIELLPGKMDASLEEIKRQNAALKDENAELVSNSACVSPCTL